MMRIIVAGSRDVTAKEVKYALQICPWIGFVSTVISGTACGADTFGERWAQERYINIVRYPAEWKKHGRSAGPIRNKVMAQNAEGLIAVWNGKSRGTLSMINLAMDYGLRIMIIRTDTNTIEQYLPSGVVADIWEFAEERAALKEYDGGLLRQDAEKEAAIASLEYFCYKHETAND
jgi:predicted Rossmann fold nucleotide-binding protein DprA/Smf involved in DNA uptake